MASSTHMRRRCGQSAPDSSSRDTEPGLSSAEVSACELWPGLPCCAARAIPLILLLIMAWGVLGAFARGAYAQPGEVLLTNAGQPPSVRLVLMSAGQRQVAQEFTTGPHPAGYDVHAVAVRTDSTGGKPATGLEARIRNRRWEPVGPRNMMLPHRQIGPTLTRSSLVADATWSWFTSTKPAHLAPNETYFLELLCRRGCFAADSGVGIGLTESESEDASSLPGWSMGDGFIIRSAKVDRWWGDMVIGADGYFQPDPDGPVLHLDIRGAATQAGGSRSLDADVPTLLVFNM